MLIDFKLILRSRLFGPFCAIAFILLAFALRSYLLVDKSVWYDEAISAWTARMPIPDIVLYQARMVHPPLHYSFLHLWGMLTGQSEYVLRFFSVASGVLAVPVLYQMGRQVAGPLAGGLAALLLTVSSFHIAWSQQIRMYALATLLGTLSTYLLLRLLARGDRRPYWMWAVYVLVNLAALYTLYLTGVVLLLQSIAVVVVLVWERRWRPLYGWLIAIMATAILYLPWLYMMKTYAGARQPISDPYRFSLIWRIYYTILSVGVDVNIDRYAWAVAPFLVMVGVWLALVNRIRHQRLAAVLLGMMLVVPPALVYAMSLPQTMFYTPALHARYFVLFLPLYALLVAWSAVLLRDYLGRWGLVMAVGAGALLALISVFALWTEYYPGRLLDDDWQSVAATVRAHRQPSDGVLLYPDEDWCIFLYHYGKGPQPIPTPDPAWYGVPYATPVTPDAAERLLRPIAAKHSSLWVVESVKAFRMDPQSHTKAWLQTNYRLAGRQAFGDKTLSLYTSDVGREYGGPLGDDWLPERSVEMEIAPGLMLLGYDQPLRRAGTGAVARLAAYWQGDTGASQRYRLAARMIGPGWDVAARVADEASDMWPAGQPLRETFETTISSLMPSGTYQWRLEVRSRQNGSLVASVPAGDLKVLRTRQPLSEALAPNRLDTSLGGEVTLLGYYITPPLGTPLAPGDKLGITLYWRGDRPMDKSYTVFVQLVGERENPARRNPVWAQQDSVPGEGSLFTTGWAPGEVVRDAYYMPVEPGTPAGTYQLHVGMYDRATGQRLELRDRSGKPVSSYVMLGEVIVK